MYLFALMLENDSRGKAGRQLKKNKKHHKLWSSGMGESNKLMEGAGWEKKIHACGSWARDYQ